MIELVGPKGYVHGWIRENPDGTHAHDPSAPRPTSDQLLAHLNSPMHEGTASLARKSQYSAFLEKAHKRMHAQQMHQHTSASGRVIELSDQRMTPVTPMKVRTAAGLSRLARNVNTTFPDLVAHQHLQDAAGAVRSGRYDGARRHLDAAINAFTPQNIRRQGVWDDVGHVHAKQFMHEAHRHLLLVKDIQDQQDVNHDQLAQRRDQKLTEAQQKAMNNAQKQPVGKSDRAAEGPNAPSPTTAAVAASWEEHLDVIDLAVKGKSPAAHRLARQGKALPDGSFPMGNKSALGKARAAYGRANPAKRGKLRALIRKRAKELNVSLKGSAFEGTRGRRQLLDLAFNINQPRDAHGRWSGVPGNMDTPNMRLALGAGFGKALGADQEARREARGTSHPGFRFTGKAGGYGHIRAIDAESQRQRDRGNDVAANALANVRDAVSRRDMAAARVHLAVASQSLRGQAGNLATVKGIADSLNAVPPGVSSRLPYGRRQAPASIGTRQPGARHGPGYYGSPTSVTGTAWEDVMDAIELSAQTGALASTPHPFGKPGGPGLWHVKGMELPPYIQNIARALLRTGRAKDLGQAIAIAKGATSRWAKGGGKVSPEVRAASAGTNAAWDAKRAQAHAHANGWQDIEDAIELAGFNPAQPRSATGQWTTGNQAQAQAGHKAGATASQKHMAHIAHLRHLAATGKISAAQKVQLAALMAALGKKATTTKAKTTSTKKASASTKAKTSSTKTKAAAKPKAKTTKPKTAKAAKPVVNKKKGTVTATVRGKRVTMSLHQWHQLHVAHNMRTLGHP